MGMRAMAGVRMGLVVAVLLVTSVCPAVAASRGDDGGHEALRAVFDAMPGTHEGTADVELLGAPMAAWTARWRMLSDARTSIHTTTWAMTKDVYALAYLGLLFEKARSGVPVKLMLDGRGAFGLVTPMKGRDYLQELVGTGRAQVRVYNPVPGHAVPAAALSWDLLALWASNHDKIIAVDGVAAITGGRNIADFYFHDVADDFQVYRDADVLVRNPEVVTALLQAFDAEFECPAASPVGRDSFGNWKDHSGELLLARHLMDEWLRAQPYTAAQAAKLRGDEAARSTEASALLARVRSSLTRRGVKLPRVNDAVARSLAEELLTAPLMRGQGRVAGAPEDRIRNAELRVLDRPSRVNASVADTINDNLEALVGAVRHELLLANPYCALTHRALAALKGAAERGVRITILTNGPKALSSGLTQAHFVRWWPEILAQVPNLRIFVFDEDHVKIHAKVGVFDGVLTTLGSYNLDLVSAQVNSEVLTVTWSPAMALRSRTYIEDLLSPGPEKVVEYRIRRDGKGSPARDGEGRVIVEFGPEDHCPAELMEGVRKQQERLDMLKRRIPGLANLL